MKWLYPLLMVFLLVLTGQSQTNVISVNVGDYGLVPKATMVTLTLISPNPRTYNNILISQVPISITTSSNGIGYFTNIIWGQYRADINANPVTKFLFVVNTNSTGAISLASLVSNPQALPPNPATNYYTQAQIDSLLSGITSSQGITNAYATNAVGVVVTNRVAFISTNYASAGVTNLTAGQLATIAAAITNGDYPGTAATFTRNSNGRLMIISPREVTITNTNDASGRASFYLDAGVNYAGKLDLFSSNGTVVLNSRYGSGDFSGSLTASNITTLGNSDIQGTLFNSTGTLNINQTGSSIDGAGINIQSGGGDNVGPNSSGGAISIATGTSYGAQNNAADLSIQAGNGSGDSSDPAVYGRGSDVNIAAGTGSGGYREGKINLNGTVTVLGSISGNGSGLTNLVTPTNFASITVTNSATMLSNVFIANNLYVTNHAYDVSTSRLDPLANEFVTAEYVQSVMAANFDLYFSTNSSGISITNVGTPSTMVLVNPTTSQTNTISSFTNGTYFTARLQTNSISYIQSVPINLYTYVQITGGGSIVAHPEMWLYNTNGTIVQLGYSSDNTYNSSIAVPVNLSIALTNTPYLNVNLTNSPQLLLRWYVTSTSGNPTWKFLVGAGNVSHITVGTIPSANQNYVGTFTGNGTGLTNIPSTGITGLGTAAYSNSTAFAASTVTNLAAGQLATIAAAVTNNASPTLTGLSVGAQTALDVNGNGKVGGVNLTNGVLTGNGSGLTNLNSTNLTGNISPIMIKEEELSLISFAVVSGNNNNPASQGFTPSPYTSQPYLTGYESGKSGSYVHQVPQWVTNSIIRFQFEYQNTNTSLTWTNAIYSAARLPYYGQNLGGSQAQFSFTLATNGYTYAYCTNTFPNTYGTNCTKYISYNKNGLGNPTNTAFGVYITGVHVWWYGNYDGTNW